MEKKTLKLKVFPETVLTHHYHVAINTRMQIMQKRHKYLKIYTYITVEIKKVMLLNSSVCFLERKVISMFL